MTGAGGQLGRALVASAPAGIQLTALGSTELDIRDAAAVSETIGRLRPDVVFNAAAYTAVDKA
ncbi:MAG: sugar nucleotide-binding protein, partial [Planctomycetota bacterium]